MSDAEATRRFFDAIAPRYDRVFAREPALMRRQMARVLEVIGPPGDVLDLGIGTGLELPALLDAGHRVVGVDASAAMIALCNQRARRATCVQADFWDGLPAKDASFDSVIALFGTLAHPPESHSLGTLALAVARVLRHPGVFYAEVPTQAWAREHARFVDEVTGAAIDVRSFSSAEWREAFAAFDLTLDERDDELVVVARKITPRSLPSPEAR
jgi:SAM-dependent methyltransferase